ncbi:MAG: hypothetical protein AB7V42_12705 [Thermoleophilia bacterium]
MRVLPIETARIAFAFIDAVPMDARNRETGELIRGRQAADPDGVPLWNVNVLAVVEGQDGGETVRVRVAAGEQPGFQPLDRVEFDGLVGRPWEQNGRSGVSFSAVGVRPAGSPNGRARASATAAAGEGS